MMIPSLYFFPGYLLLEVKLVEIADIAYVGLI